jgi:hypothetical protein
MLVVVAGISGFGYAAEVLPFARYQEIVHGETNAPLAMKKVQEYLVSLSHDDFMAFIRQAGKQAEYAREDAGAVTVLAIFAKYYKQGAGKDESFLAILKQLSDPELPSSWKMALLDVIRLDARNDLAELEIASVVSALSEAGLSKQNSDVFRSFVLAKLGFFLSMQRELLARKAPDLKIAMEENDKTALPKRDDAAVRQAAKLIDAVRDYRTALKKTVDEVQDAKIKNKLRNSLSKWETASAPPNE